MPPRGTGDQACHRDGIAADIEDAAAGEIVGEQAMACLDRAHVETEARLDQPDFTDRTRLHQFYQLRCLRMQAVHIGLAGEDPGLVGLVIDGLGLMRRERDGLFHQHMLARADRLDRPFGMADMRGGDVDRLDIRVVDQRLIAGDDAGARELFGQARPVGVARADGNEPPGSRMGDTAGESAGDGSGADNSPVDRFRAVHGLLPSMCCHAARDDARGYFSRWPALSKR